MTKLFSLTLLAFLIFSAMEANASKNMRNKDETDFSEQGGKKKRKTAPKGGEVDPMEEDLDPHAQADLTLLEDDVLDASLFALLNEKRRREEEKTEKEPDVKQKIVGFQNVGLYHQLTAKLISAIQGETEETAPDMVLQAFYESENYRKAADLCDQLPDAQEGDKEEIQDNASIPMKVALGLCMAFNQQHLLAGVLAQQAQIEGTDPEELKEDYGEFIQILNAVNEEEEVNTDPPAPGDPNYFGPSDCGFTSDWVYKKEPSEED